MKWLIPALVALAACTRPYAVPEVSPDRAFLGVSDYLQAEGAARIVLSHGMCSGEHRASGTDTNWVGQRAAQIARSLGVLHTPEPAYQPSAVYPPGAGPDEPAVRRYDVSFVQNEKPVTASFLIWGSFVDAYRENLEFENTRRSSQTPEAPRRARLNADVKSELMNRCLIDAVVYLGRNGDPIRRNMRHAVCELLGGQFTPAKRPGDARSSGTCRNPKRSGVPTVLIPESLGSTILFEAYMMLDDRQGQRALARSLGDVRSVFMASNQYALLRQGTVSDGQLRTLDARPQDALGAFLAARLGQTEVQSLTQQSRPDFQLVAITDPNDVLGYRVDGQTLSGLPVDYRNVLVSNTDTILQLAADPIKAHRDTARPQVFDLIVKGYTPQ